MREREKRTVFNVIKFYDQLWIVDDDDDAAGAINQDLLVFSSVEPLKKVGSW